MPITVDDLECEQRESRMAHHDRCDDDFELSGNSFSFVAHPYSRVKGLSCPNCGLAKFGTLTWVDTGERLSDYRKRIKDALYNSAPTWVQRFPVILAVAFALLAGGAGFLATADLAGMAIAFTMFAILGSIGLACGFALGYISRGAMLVGRLRERNIDARHIS